MLGLVAPALVMSLGDPLALDLCLEFINLLLEILKGRTLRLTLSCKSPFRDQNQNGNRDEC